MFLRLICSHIRHAWICFPVAMTSRSSICCVSSGQTMIRHFWAKLRLNRVRYTSYLPLNTSDCECFVLTHDGWMNSTFIFV